MWPMSPPEAWNQVCLMPICLTVHTILHSYVKTLFGRFVMRGDGLPNSPNWFQKETLLQICEVVFMHKLRSLVTRSYFENAACLAQTSSQVGGRVGLLLWIRFALPTFLPLAPPLLACAKHLDCSNSCHSKRWHQQWFCLSLCIINVKLDVKHEPSAIELDKMKDPMKEKLQEWQRLDLSNQGLALQPKTGCRTHRTGFKKKRCCRSVKWFSCIQLVTG